MRADASPQIGTGHVRRCLAIAAALRSRGAAVHFVTRPAGEYSERLFAGSDIPVAALSSGGPSERDASGWPEDAAATRAAIDAIGARPRWLIVDHYGLDERWERQMRPHVARILAIDDLGNRAHDADVLIDPNLVEDAERRYCAKLPAPCLRLFGPRYAPLRDEFRLRRADVAPRNGRVDRILVFHGGGPLAARCTLAAIDALAGLRLGSASVDVVFSAEARDRKAIAAACDRHDFTFHPATTRMAELMSAAGLAIGAGGTTLWERCCLGLPSLAFALADNQREQVRQAASLGVVLAPAIPPEDAAAVAGQIAACLENPALLATVSRCAMSVVDGHGTLRLMRALGILQVRVRSARDADCEAMHEWRNEAAVRLASRDPAPIDYETHRRWFTSTLADSGRLLLVGEVAGKPVGVVRYDIDGRSARLSIYLAPGSEGQGFGAELLQAAESRLGEARPEVEHVVAEVLGINEPSRRLFESSGFALRESRYVKEIR